MAIEHFVVHKSSDYLCAFPDLIRLQNGDLVAVFRESPIYPGTGNPMEKRDEKITHYHAAPNSRIALVRSIDDGVTWSADSRVMIDTSDGTQDLNMPLITQLSSGELIVANHRWFMNMTEEQVTALEGKRLIQGRPQAGTFGAVGFDSLYIIRSSDQGYTWSKPQPVKSTLTYCAFIGKNAIVEMPDGSWLMPLYGRTVDDEIEVGALSDFRVYIDRSWDGGQTWEQPSTIAYDPEQRISFHEPPLLRLPNGKLLTVMRTSGANGYLYQAFSLDNGWTWQGLKRTPMWGFPCHLLRLRSGRLLCTYGYRREPFGIRASLSEDEGKTWDVDREIVIRDDGFHRDLGYPASIQLQDDRILSIYYFHDEEGIRYIGGSIYTED